MRADQLLVERGLAASRSQAVRLIAGGLRWRDAGSGDAWRDVVKNKDDVPESAELELLDAAEARYVSRGGLKLEGALAASGIDAAGKLCLDVGQSTGGFTDCLLQRGAARVVGVDVGHGQLHARLREDERVVAIEGVNARALSADDLGEEGESRFDLVVGDLSFISLTLVLPAVVEFLADEGRLLMLVKPQFELQPGQVGKGGIVRDESMYAVVEKRLRDACEALGLRVLQWFDSPIAGGDGNREFFIHAERAVRANGS
ncbi:TlyA family RNA methyltransferase [Variovorax sp. 375MFSha3.1]|uniref:23S rRNA (Cytidine1920-2'-O)/16S rRNA (Cytidine1409-2'-O)-methyltransferase n=1 Tax=Variovorax guangxiensis TaxID=1775474 RepID=A0A840FWD8_9BURK|nr:TlyA family RNA methyltransferase [Variovorax guangxiensis]MBB4223760.1 23S rRNA (cytidine1920-2'-O)/16S rRNA (cytidine1409-2'-O)-methyltransferase [Variovorax guangxiensis]